MTPKSGAPSRRWVTWSRRSVLSWPGLGTSRHVGADIEAALTTRLDSLRAGGKGAMFDVVRSIPMEHLVDYPVVLELERLGDDGDKAFVMGLVLIRLVEHRRAQGASDQLEHLLVVEEAHRLLANVTQSREDVGNPRQYAVETFTNLLAEVRAYGEGVVIADQVPVRLAPDIVKNTNLKIAHRIVAADDRLVLGAAMAMDDAQTRALTTLAVGEAAVFGGGDDTPLLIGVPLVKDELANVSIGDDVVTREMRSWRAGGLEALFRPRPFCEETCETSEACEAARAMLDADVVQRAVARTVLSMIEDFGALDRMWDDLLSVIRSRRSARLDEDSLLRSFAGHAADDFAERRGRQASWLYRDVDELATHLRTRLPREAAGSGLGRDWPHLCERRTDTASPNVRAVFGLRRCLYARPTLVSLSGGGRGPRLDQTVSAVLEEGRVERRLDSARPSDPDVAVGSKR